MGGEIGRKKERSWRGTERGTKIKKERKGKTCLYAIKRETERERERERERGERER